MALINAADLDLHMLLSLLNVPYMMTQGSFHKLFGVKRLIVEGDTKLCSLGITKYTVSCW